MIPKSISIGASPGEGWVHEKAPQLHKNFENTPKKLVVQGSVS